MGNTHGTWLPGDPRGFRTWRDHRHIEGDYRNPPPKGTYDQTFGAAQLAMKRPPVRLSAAQRPVVLEELLTSFRKWRVDVAVISVGGVHFHALARFPACNPRHFIGLAKKESSAYLRRAGHAPPGGLWAERCECVPIRDLEHFYNVFAYILKHAEQGSAVWKDPGRCATAPSFPDPHELLVD